MLILSRKVNEKIHIGDNVVIEVWKVAGNRVHIAIDAPLEVTVLRGELLDCEAAKSDEPVA